MTRIEIKKKFNFITKSCPQNPKMGDCYALPNLSIEQQLKRCKEGHGQLFFLRIGKVIEREEFNLQLVSESIYISPTKYV